MINYIAVFIGGGIGCVLRFATNNFYIKHFDDKIFHATFFSNIIGSFILGVFFDLFLIRQDINPSLRYAIIIGFCGGLTTFSTFSLEIFEMIKTGAFLSASLYIVASVAVSLLAVFLGFNFARGFYV